ncbi:hypothetical protein O5559_27100, partial [Escherichia coli]|nr:hypothetical protein [Escherichia coli]
KQSHAGSSKQALAILQGLKADVVNNNQVTDVQILHDKGKLIPADWQTRLPNNSLQFYDRPAKFHPPQVSSRSSVFFFASSESCFSRFSESIN